MQYLFFCKKCNKEEYRNFPMADYDIEESKQFCECGEKMLRKLEPPSSVKLCSGMYGTSNGGWNN